MLSHNDNTLQFDQYMKSYVIYADLESLIKRIDGCPNNLQNPSTTKIGENIPCRY